MFYIGVPDWGVCRWIFVSLLCRGLSCIVRRAGEREKEIARGIMGRGRNLVPVFFGNPAPSWMHYMAEAPAFSLFLWSPARFLFFDYCYFYWDTQREPLRRREDLRQMPSSSSLRACYPPGGVARSHARPTCECEARHPSSRLESLLAG